VLHFFAGVAVAPFDHGVRDEISSIDVPLVTLQNRLGALRLALDALHRMVPLRRHDAAFLSEDGRRIHIENARQWDPAQLQPAATRLQIVATNWMTFAYFLFLSGPFYAFFICKLRRSSLCILHVQGR
jgi:hypothetical protein